MTAPRWRISIVRGIPPKVPVGRCYLCGERTGDRGIADAFDHLRIMHPAEYGDGPERWPDGSLVVVDKTDYTADEIGGSS